MLGLTHVTCAGDPATLRDVSFEAPAGAVTGVVCTPAERLVLELVVTGRRRPDGGAVLVDGRGLSRRAVARMGYLPGETRTGGRDSVLDRLAFFTELNGATRPEGLDRARHALARLRAEELGDLLMADLVGAPRRLAQLAGALVCDHDVLVLGEPLRDLDAGTARRVSAVIRDEAARGVTVVVLASDPAGLDDLCDDLVVLENGAVTVSSARACVDSASAEVYRLELEEGDLGWVRDLPEVRVQSFSPLDVVFEVDDVATAQSVLVQAVAHGTVRAFTHVERRLSDSLPDATRREALAQVLSLKVSA